MEQVFRRLLLFFMCLTMSYAADFLENPDFEIPPTNLTSSNATSQLLPLNKTNSIPGWSFNGTVTYITSSGNNHALQLGQNGKINQTLRAKVDEVFDYIMCFTLSAQDVGCVDNRTAVNVSIRQSFCDKCETWKVLDLQRNSSTSLWERHALYLGRLGGGETVSIEINSVATDSNCWPVVDALTVNRNGMPTWYNGNILANGDFEVGPAFLKNSSEGIILNEEPDRFNSPLQEWSILGTIKYIDSEHHKVPHGKAAIELLSGDPSGIQMDRILPTTLTYTLNFTLGDANDSCVGDFVLHIQIGLDVYNFTMRSIGTGSTFKHSLTFKSKSSRETSMGFYRFNETRTRDGVLCGPVLDNIVLFGSYGERIEMHNGVLVFSLFVALMIIAV